MATTNITQGFLTLTKAVFHAFSCVIPRRKDADKYPPSDSDQSPIDEDIVQIEQDCDAEDEEEEIDLETLELMPFQPTIRLIDFEALKAYALKVRAQLSGNPEVQPQNPGLLTCSIDEKPMHGGFNIVYVVRFSDGCRWVARIPINAPNFATLDEQKMDSEYHTMRYLRKDLQMTIPQVFAWHTTSEIIGAPFALILFVSGVSVRERWADPELHLQTNSRISLPEC